MKQDVIGILKKVGAILDDDHFVLTSGRHAATYINKDALYPYTKEVSQVGKLFAEKYKEKDIDVIVGPALGGVVLSQWTAHHLTQFFDKQVLGVYTEKDSEGKQVFRRGYNRLVKEKKTLIVEDLTTTGGSVRKVAQEVEKAGGDLVEICVMVNKNHDSVDSKRMGYPFDFLESFKVIDYPGDSCPLCEQGVSINTDVGHGEEFLKQKNKKLI